MQIGANPPTIFLLIIRKYAEHRIRITYIQHENHLCNAPSSSISHHYYTIMLVFLSTLIYFKVKKGFSFTEKPPPTIYHHPIDLRVQIFLLLQLFLSPL